MTTNGDAVKRAFAAGVAVPAFNIPYLPMMAPIARAVKDADSYAFVAVARLEFYKFGAKSLEAIFAEYERTARCENVGLHLDHVPVIDEDNQRVDFLAVIGRALELGYGSVMVDGSRLPLDENIKCTAEAVALAHSAGVECEAELGAVLGHEAGPLPDYEELFASGRGFTVPSEAKRFVEESGCDWLSVAIGNIHGAISAGLRDSKKATARLAIDHLVKLRDVAGVPLVLHGGSGIDRTCAREAFRNGIAKINIGTEVRQAYEAGLRDGGSEAAGQEATYRRTTELLTDYYGLAGNRKAILGA